MKPTFYKIIFIKKIPYWMYWPSIGLVGYMLSDLLCGYFKEQPYYISRGIAAFTFATVPTLNIWLYASFVSLLQKVSQSLWPTQNDETVKWIHEIYEKIFTLKSPVSRIATGFIIICGTATVFVLGLPFSHAALNVIGVLTFGILLWFCGQTMYISFALLFALHRIVKHPVKIPFLLIPHPTISNLQSFYSYASLSITFLYALLVVAIWQGPYGLNPILLIWLTMLAFYPSSMWAWSFAQIHKLQQLIKQSQVQVINIEIQRALEALIKSNSVDNIERLDKLIKIQNEVQKIREWPIAFGNLLSFMITILATITQVIVLFNELSSP